MAEEQQQAADDRRHGWNQRVVDNRWLLAMSIIALIGWELGAFIAMHLAGEAS